MRGIAVYGPGATLFTMGANNTVQQFDLNAPAVLVKDVQHPANLLPPSPPVSIEEQAEMKASSTMTGESESMSIPITAEVSESDEDHLSPLARIVRGNAGALDDDAYRVGSPVSTRSSTVSKSSAGSRTHGARTGSVQSKLRSDHTHISIGSTLHSGTHYSSHRSHKDPAYRDAYSISSLSSAATSNKPRHRPSRLRNEVLRSPDDNKVTDLFKFTRSRLNDVPYKRPTLPDTRNMTNDDLRRQMLSIIFGWDREIEDLVRDEMNRHPEGSASRILLAKWLGDIDADIMTTSSESMTSSDWMLLALSGIGGQASQHKLGRAYVQRLLENGDVHAAATIMIGLGDYNDAIEIYNSHKKHMEALILTCLFFPTVWERQSVIVKKWGDWAVQHGQQQLAIRCFASTGQESSEPWKSPSADKVNFDKMTTSTIPEMLSPPLSPPTINRGPQRSIAKASALKLITSFDDKPGGKSKFFAAGGDGGQTPLAGGVTPIAESAISPSGHGLGDPTTAFVRPGARSTFNTPSSARGPGPQMFARSRLPSIGEVAAAADNREALRMGDLPTPPVDVVPDHGQTSRHHRQQTQSYATQDNMAAGLALQRAATASPMMMRDRGHARQAVAAAEDTNPPPPPSAEMQAALERRGRNGSRSRIPEGVSLQLQTVELGAAGSDVTSPEQSVASSTRFHWPTRRRGPGSVASSVTSTSSVGNRNTRGALSSAASTSTAGRSLDDYVHSLDAAQHYSSSSRRHRSRHRHAEPEMVEKPRSREHSRSRKTSSNRERSEERGRSTQRGWTPKPAKRSPTSPIPMSPEDLINLSTPRVPHHHQSFGFGADDLPTTEDPQTVRKVSAGRPSSRASSRTGATASDSRGLPALSLNINAATATRGRSDSRPGDAGFAAARGSSVGRSPSSPKSMSAIPPPGTLPGGGSSHGGLLTLQLVNQPQQRASLTGSDDESDLQAALEDQERFRNRHNRSVSKGLREPQSPAVGNSERERSESRRRAAVSGAASAARSSTTSLASSKHNAGDLKLMKLDEQRRLKKEAAARELEERRKSLARRLSAPPVPPQLSSVAEAQQSQEDGTDVNHVTTTTFVPKQDPVPRSQTVDPHVQQQHLQQQQMQEQVRHQPMVRGMFAPRNGTGPVIGLPATPKAMRLKFESDNKGIPPIPSGSNVGSRSGPPSPPTQQPQQRSQQPSPKKEDEGLTLLPSTVYTPPSRANIPRSMSAPPEELPQKRRTGHASDRHERHGASMRGIDETLVGSNTSDQQSSSRHHHQQPPPPPPPPILKELQHLAIPPPPPPAPLPFADRQPPVAGLGLQPTVVPTGTGVIEIVMDEDETAANNNNAAGTANDTSSQSTSATPQLGAGSMPTLVPLTDMLAGLGGASPPPPVPTGLSNRAGHHTRGRSIGGDKDNSIAGRISRATERIRSVSRGRSSAASAAARTKSPEQSGQHGSPAMPAPYESVGGQRSSSVTRQWTRSPDAISQAPYESVPPMASIAAVTSSAVPPPIERHPREVKAAMEQAFGQQRTGLHESEMI